MLISRCVLLTYTRWSKEEEKEEKIQEEGVGAI
jgi:hypothetical protein